MLCYAGDISGMERDSNKKEYRYAFMFLERTFFPYRSSSISNSNAVSTFSPVSCNMHMKQNEISGFKNILKQKD